MASYSRKDDTCMKETVRQTRRERERMRHRREILDGALELFANKGYHNVTMHQIAERAEFAVGTLYKFFNDKEDLYKALVKERATELHSILRDVLEAAGDEVAKVRNYIREKGRIFSANLPLVRLYFAETRGASFNIRAGLDREIRQLYDQLLKNLAAVFRAGICKGRFRKMDPYYMALALDGMTNTFLLAWLEDPKKHPYEKNADLIENLFFEKVLLKG